MASEQEIIEEELVYGALRRERLWQLFGLSVFVGIVVLYGVMAWLIVRHP